MSSFDFDFDVFNALKLRWNQLQSYTINLSSDSLTIIDKWPLAGNILATCLWNHVITTESTRVITTIMTTKFCQLQ